MGRIKAIRILPEFPLLDRALTGWAQLPAALLPARVLLLLPATPRLLCAPFCSPLLLLSCVQVVLQSQTVPYPAVTRDLACSHVGVRRVEVTSPRAEPALKLHLMHSEMLIGVFFPLLKSSWNCGNQTLCVKTRQGAAKFPAFPGTRGSLWLQGSLSPPMQLPASLNH